MTTLSPVLRNILGTPITSSSIHTDTAFRYFTEFDSSIGQYIEIPPVLTNDTLEGEITFTYTSGNTKTLLCGSTGRRNAIVLDVNSNSLRMFVYESNSLSGLLRIPIEKSAYHRTAYFSIKDSVLSLSLGDVTDTTPVSINGLQDIAFIGRRPGHSSTWEGHIWNVRLNDRLYKLDEDFSNTSVAVDSNEVIDISSEANNSGEAINIDGSGCNLFTEHNDGEWLGEELISQHVWENPETVQAQWTFSDNKWTLDSTGALSVLRLLPEDEYPSIIRISGGIPYIEGSLALVSDVTVTVNSAGYYKLDIITPSSGVQFKRNYKNGVKTKATICKPSIRALLKRDNT